MPTLVQDITEKSNPNIVYNSVYFDINSTTGAHLTRNYENPANLALGIVPTSDDIGAVNLDLSVDGIIGGDYTELSSLTAIENNLKFDLLTEKKGRKLHLYRRIGSNYAFLYIRVSKDSIQWDEVYNSDSTNALGFGVGADGRYTETIAGKSFDLSGKIVRYIEIYSGVDSDNLIEFDEVEIYEYSYWTNIVPTLKISTPVNFNVFNSLTSVTTVVNAEIKYNIQLDGIVYYHNGINWERYTESTFTRLQQEGTAFYKANTIAEITTNWYELQSNYNLRSVVLIVHFKSSDGTATPTLETVTWNYDIDTSNFSTNSIVEVFGVVLDLSGNPPSTPAKVTAVLQGAVNINHRSAGYESFYSSVVETYTDTRDGHFTLPLVRTTDFLNSKNAKWRVRVEGIGEYAKPFSIPVTVGNSVSIKELVEGS